MSTAKLGQMSGTVVGSGNGSLDELLGGWLPGDNVVWVSEHDGTYRQLEQAFLIGAAGSRPMLFVATSRAELKRALPKGVERLDASSGSKLRGSVALAVELERRLVESRVSCVVIDGLDRLARRWGADEAMTFFARTCPMMLQTDAITYWRVPRSLGPAFLERLRQVTQCMLELRADQLHVLKAEGRPAAVQGSVHRLDATGGTPRFVHDPAGGRLARGLAAVRKDLGLTQAQLAEAAGVTPSAVSQAESGSRGLSVDTLITLSDRLGVSLDRLVSGRPTPGYRLARHDRGRAPSGRALVPLADDSLVGMRAFSITLGAHERSTPPLAHQGVELIAVLRGLVQVDAGDDTPVLRAGDSLLAVTSPITGWTNLRPDPAAFYWILRD